LADEPYYLGGYWAWSYHRLTEQVHGSRIDAFVTRWRPARAVANARIVFHRTAPARLMFGTVQVTIEHLAVCVSDLERTLLDALDYPNLLGSLSDSVERVTAALHKANTKQLIAHAAHGSRSSTCQRIGLLLERHGVPAAALQPLRRRVMRSASVLSLWPNRQRSGRVHPLWRVVENDQDGRD